MKFFGLNLFIVIFFLVNVRIFSEETVLILNFTGKPTLKRNNASIPLKRNMFLELMDEVQIDKGNMDLQINQNAVLRIGPNSSFTITKMRDEKDPENSMHLSYGSLYIKVLKVKGSDTKFKFTTPTKVAGVRGTKFCIKEGETQEEEESAPGVFVAEGSVVVEDLKSTTKKSFEVESGKQLVESSKGLMTEILDQKVRATINILDELKMMKQSNLNIMIEQRKKNKELMKKTNE
jgi:hypothetical protein